MKWLEPAALTLIISLRFLFCAYRASTQSITHDEAFTYNVFLDGRWSNIFDQFDANNHVLLSILAKASIATFGLTEFTLRLPTLLSGVALLVGAVFVMKELVASRALRLGFILALCLHPLLLDLSIAARGYGLALACFLWALYLTMRGRLLLAGCALGLSVASNLTMVFPAMGLIVSSLVAPRGGWRTLWRPIVLLGLPALAIAGAVLWRPLSHARPAQFYAGADTIRESLYSLVLTSVRHQDFHFGWLGSDQAIRAIQYGLLPAAALCIIVGAFWTWMQAGSWSLVVGTTAVTTIGVILSHVLLNTRYPADRTGLYLVVLFMICCTASLERLRHRGAIVGCVLTVFYCAQCATQLDARSFSLWRYDMNTKRVMQEVARRTQPPGDRTWKISPLWIHQPALEFYRRQLRLGNVEPVVRRATMALSGYDFYVHNNRYSEERVRADTPVLYADPESGILLAAR